MSKTLDLAANSVSQYGKLAMSCAAQCRAWYDVRKSRWSMPGRKEALIMLIPDEVLDILAERYCKSGNDPERYPFLTWATVEAEKMGFQF